MAAQLRYLKWRRWNRLVEGVQKTYHSMLASPSSWSNLALTTGSRCAEPYANTGSLRIETIRRRGGRASYISGLRCRVTGFPSVSLGRNLWLSEHENTPCRYQPPPDNSVNISLPSVLTCPPTVTQKAAICARAEYPPAYQSRPAACLTAHPSPQRHGHKVGK